MTEHTPGPWEWWTSCSWNRLRHSDRGVSTNVLYPVAYKDGQPSIEATEADMRLIAAAPDMLAALKMLIGDAEDGKGVMFSQRYEAAKRAIAKAEGRQ